MHISYIFYVLDGLKLHILSPRCTVHGRSREPRPSVTNIECHAFFLSKCMFVGGKHMTVLYAKTRERSHRREEFQSVTPNRQPADTSLIDVELNRDFCGRIN